MCAYEFITGADLIICGDFNIPTFSNSVALDARSGAVNDFMSFANVTQKNTFKNANNRLLDLILSNVEYQLFLEDDSFVGVDEQHPPLLINVVLNTADRKHSNFESCGLRDWTFRRANFNLLYSMLAGVDWSFLEAYTDAEAACDAFYKVLNSVLSECVPAEYFPRRRCGRPPWITPKIIRYINFKNKYQKCYKKYHTDFYLINLEVCMSSLVKKQIRQSHRVYLTNIESSINNNTKECWSYIYSTRGSTRIPGIVHFGGETATELQTILNAFANYFSVVYARPTSGTCATPSPGSGHCFNMPMISESEILRYIKGLKDKEQVVRDLGVEFDGSLSFIPHIEATVKSTSKMLGFVIRNGKEFNSEALKRLYYRE
ncbi:hypothetical protein QE152_g34849 [Popillia japonica]|uniref:Endonuclease/exonuclease/phosphatase domain-containing protein n=1 Tax=Popillia japonica TaxID=7064 RepID=A0AAW1IT01_POPJA